MGVPKAVANVPDWPRVLYGFSNSENIFSIDVRTEDVGGDPQLGPSRGAVNWNRASTTGVVSANIDHLSLRYVPNCESVKFNHVGFGDNSEREFEVKPILGELKTVNDWERLTYSFRVTRGFGLGAVIAPRAQAAELSGEQLFNLSVGALDVDGDGVENEADNCPAVPNANQSDQDSDGRGDVCDNCERANPAQADVNENGVGDECEQPNPLLSPGTIGETTSGIIWFIVAAGILLIIGFAVWKFGPRRLWQQVRKLREKNQN